MSKAISRKRCKIWPRVQLITNKKLPVESNGTTLDPLGWPLIRVLDPHFGVTVYIYEVNGSRKVESIAQVAMNKNSYPVQKFFRGGPRGQCPDWIFSKLLEMSETSRARKIILELQVNIDKANSRRYDVGLLGRWYIAAQKRSAIRISVYTVDILRSQMTSNAV